MRMSKDEEERVDYECHRAKIENETAKKSFNARLVAISHGSEDRKEKGTR